MKSVFLVSILFLLLAGCGNKEKKTESAVPPTEQSERSKEPPLPYMQPTLRDLAAAVVEAVADSNVDLLYNMMVTKDEYRDYVWANLDTVEVRGLTVDEVWGWNARDSDKAIGRMVGDYAHKEIQFTRLDPPRDIRTRGNIKVYRGNWIHVQPRDEQEEATWRMINVVMEYQGWFKVITYDD
ncbi:MAG: hypothetical protein KDB65_08325 [Calditrichaeota bacterium]|nr:hypothetical protein [Calditrichota bacterium]MCB9369917.1 hypothetical protein [Calditrichota bacterium]